MQQSVASLNPPSSFTFRLTAKGAAKALSAVVLTLLVLHVLGLALRLSSPENRESTKNWTDLVDFDSEANLPAWYSSLTLLFCAALLGMIGLSKRVARDRFALHWMGLGLIFVFLSADELSRVHERLSFTLKTLWHLGGILRFAWVIPGAIFALVLAVAYWRFLLHLPKSTRYLLLGAGAIFVMGAIGIEMLTAARVDSVGRDNLLYYALATVEELLEMSGIVLFVYTLLDYMHRHVNLIALHIGGKS